MKIDILPRRLFYARARARCVFYRGSLSKEIANCFGQSSERTRERNEPNALRAREFDER